MRDHIEEWDQISNHDIGDEYMQNSMNGDDAMIRVIKEKLHGITPDVRKYLIIDAHNNFFQLMPVIKSSARNLITFFHRNHSYGIRI